MNSDKKLYLYSGLTVALAVVAYIVITRKKTLPNSSEEENAPEENQDGVVTSTGDTISNEQVIVPPTLSLILNKPTPQATIALKNKPVYTKLDNVKVRNENFVNNGILNNIMSEITNAGFLLGNVIEIKDDKGGLKNIDGRVYKWFRIKPAQVTLDEMNRNKSFLTHVFLPSTTGKQIYVREDAVKLEQ